MVEKSKTYKKKQFFYLATVLAIIMAIIMLGSTLLSNKKNDKMEKINLPKIKYEDRKEIEENSFKKTYGRELTLLKQKLQEQEQELKQLKKSNKQKKEEKKNFLGMPLKNPNSLSINIPPPVQNDKNKQNDKNDKLKSTTIEYSVMSDIIYFSPEKTNKQEDTTTKNIKKLTNSKGTTKIPSKSTSSKKKSVFKVPAGSFVKGVLLNGIDAPTASNAKANPHPVAIRFIDKSILPNNFKADIKDCVAIASGYGELSSERAIIRVEKVSCIKEDGTILTSKGNSVGYVTGEDGKVGLEGNVVSRQGAIIARAMAADFFSGISGVLKEANQPETAIADNGTTSIPQINAGRAMKIGTFAGLNGATAKLSDFYLKLNDQMFPVVEIAIGRTCDIIFNKTLSFEKEE